MKLSHNGILHSSLFPRKMGQYYLLPISDSWRIIQSNPWHMPNTQYFFDVIGRFQFSTVAYLNMVYYSNMLGGYSHNLCTSVLPWGKYQYQGLPMGVSIHPYVLQDKISMLFQYMVHIFVYMDYLVVIDQDTIKTHMDILDHVINWLEKSGNQFNTVKFNWGWYSVTYLWFFLLDMIYSTIIQYLIWMILKEYV